MSASRQTDHVRHCASARKTSAVEHDIHDSTCPLEEVYCSAVDLQFGQGTIAGPTQDAGTLLARLGACAGNADIRIKRKHLAEAAVVDIPYVRRAVANHF